MSEFYKRSRLCKARKLEHSCVCVPLTGMADSSSRDDISMPLFGHHSHHKHASTIFLLDFVDIVRYTGLSDYPTVQDPAEVVLRFDRLVFF